MKADEIRSRRPQLLRIKSERFELPGPFGGRIAKTLDANATGQATLDRGPDERKIAGYDSMTQRVKASTAPSQAPFALRSVHLRQWVG